jgi:hypothetical protein
MRARFADDDTGIADARGEAARGITGHRERHSPSSAELPCMTKTGKTHDRLYADRKPVYFVIGQARHHRIGPRRGA